MAALEDAIAAGVHKTHPVTDGLFDLARNLVLKHATMGLRSLDGLQLATAVELEAKLFVTADRKLARAAAAEGIKVLAFLPKGVIQM